MQIRTMIIIALAVCAMFLQSQNMDLASSSVSIPRSSYDLLLNLNQMSPACSANSRELGLLEIWENLLDFYTKILPPESLEIVEV
jgi:hypothetical protein